VRFTEELAVLFLMLIAKRFELMGDSNDIALLDSQIVDFGKERDRILELMKQQNIEGIDDERRWYVLQKNFVFEQNRINEALTNRAQLVEKLHPKHLEFMRDCIHHTTILGRLLVPVISSFREELELLFDFAAYQELINESITRQQQAVDDFLLKQKSSTTQTITP
jgi:hypothetical protein